jgi:hypothetical protein
MWIEPPCFDYEGVGSKEKECEYVGAFVGGGNRNRFVGIAHFAADGAGELRTTGE